MGTKKNSFRTVEESIERNENSSFLSELRKLQSEATQEWKNLLTSTPNTAKEQITGNQSKTKELINGEEIMLSPAEEEENVVEKNPNHERYVTREIDSQQIESIKREEKMNENQIEEIKDAIKELIQSTEEMENAFKEVANDVTVSDTPKEPGKYHVGFFEWVLTTIKQARQRIENGNNWLNAFANKKQQKGYWGGKVKKGGFINVHMSSERSAVNQTG